MRKSLRLKLAVLLFAMTAGTIAISLLFNMLFLQKYYLRIREEAILSVYNELSSAVASAAKGEEEETTDSSSSGSGENGETDSGGQSQIESDMDIPYFDNREEMGDSDYRQSYLFDDQTVSSLSQLCDKNGVSVYAIDKSGSRVFAFGATYLLHSRLYNMFFGSIANYETEPIEVTDTYVLQTVTENNMGYSQRYLELYGIMQDNQVFFLMRVAMESIEESASITNEFYLYVSCVLMVICLIILLIVSKSFTKPILKLADLSKEMTALNFNAKYHGNSQDEIGILGNSMNELSETLEKTISELKAANLELQTDIKRKEEIDSMRTDFLSNVSHELKTPLALIQGYAEGLKDCVNDDDESRDYYCDVIIDEAGKMNRMVKKLLTLNQIEFGTETPDIQRFCITELINGVLNSVSIMLKQQGIRVYFDASDKVEIWADEYQIEEVLTNYISNAIHHCSGDKQIRIWLEDRGEILRVNVFNTGLPIPEEDIPHIWDKFYKVDKAHTREYGGNGIGLSIVKAIMDSSGQQYGVSNEKNGVTFWFEADKRLEQ